MSSLVESNLQESYLTSRLFARLGCERIYLGAFAVQPTNINTLEEKESGMNRVATKAPDVFTIEPSDKGRVIRLWSYRGGACNKPTMDNIEHPDDFTVGEPKRFYTEFTLKNPGKLSRDQCREKWETLELDVMLVLMRAFNLNAAEVRNAGGPTMTYRRVVADNGERAERRLPGDAA